VSINSSSLVIFPNLAVVLQHSVDVIRPSLLCCLFFSCRSRASGNAPLLFSINKRHLEHEFDDVVVVHLVSPEEELSQLVFPVPGDVVMTLDGTLRDDFVLSILGIA